MISPNSESYSSAHHPCVTRKVKQYFVDNSDRITVENILHHQDPVGRLWAPWLQQAYEPTYIKSRITNAYRNHLCTVYAHNLLEDPMIC